MPPSGFVAVETATLASVAESLLARFQSEVSEGKHTSREVGITTELATIHRALASDIPHTERGVLMFVRELYLALKAGKTAEEIERELRALESKKYE